MKPSGILVLSEMVQIVGKFGSSESGERLKDFHSQSAGSHTPMNCFQNFEHQTTIEDDKEGAKVVFLRRGEEGKIALFAWD